jgi:hypothetical protein
MSKRPRGKPFPKGRSANPGGVPKSGTKSRRRKTAEAQQTIAELKEAVRALTPKAVATLERILDNPEAPVSAQVAAANSVIDRALGKPVQPIEGGDRPITWQMIVQQALAIPRDQVKPPPWLEQELAAEAAVEKEKMN